MAKTKDYDDYIDWTYDNGFDPADFDSYDEYVEAVLKKVPPVNYNRWERDSKKLLQSELTSFFTGIELTGSHPEPGADAPGEIREDVATEKRGWRAKSIDKSIRWQTKRTKKPISKTTKAQIKSIKHKVQKDQKFTKAERKLFNRSKMSRSWELQRKFGYTRSEALSKASKEYKY